MEEVNPPDAERAPSTGLQGIPVLYYGTPDFRENSVHILAEACAASPIARILPHDVLGVLRFRDVDAMLRDPLTFSSKVELLPQPEGTEPLGVLIGDDPPDHTRLRMLFGQSFTPARLAATMEPRILTITRDLVQRIRDGGREFDLVRDLAVPLPVTVISELLGVDAQDLPRFTRWSDDVTAAILVVGWPDSPEKTRRMAEIHQSLRDLDDYLARVLDERRKRPADDLITFLINASVGATRLTRGEVLSLAKLLLVAGNETTTKLIGLLMNQLLANPPTLRELGDMPSHIPSAIEEAVRLEGPVYNRLRRTTRPCTIAGVSVPADVLVDCVIGAADLDERVFPDPTRFDIHRVIPRHFGFGGGIHQCLGAPLARLEARIVYEELLAHVQDLELVAPPTRGTSSSFRGFEHMPLRYKPRDLRSPSATGQVEQEVAVADKLARRSDGELGLDKRAREVVRVARVRDIAENIKMFRFVHPQGGLLTRFSAGSHIIVHMRDGKNVYREAYSLLNCEYGNGFSYIIAVALDPDGRGGSRYMHEQVRAGMELLVSVPANNFPAVAHATKHLLIAGGIGITPLFALRHELRARGERCSLHYTFRAAARAAFVEELDIESDPRVRCYDNSKGQRLDVESLIACQPEGTHVYVCGPESLMDAVIEAALRHGWPREQVHFERFGAPKPKDELPFEVFCARSNLTLTVNGASTLLEVLEAAGLPVSFACRAGSCGACQVTVIDGEIDHRDTVLTAEERAEGNKLQSCVSRGKGRLVLDL